MNEKGTTHQHEAGKIRDDLFNNLVTLNNLTSEIKMATITKQSTNDFFADWIKKTMVVVTYTRHEPIMESKAENILRYIDDEPQKELIDRGLPLVQDYIKTLFQQGVVNYHE